MADFLQVFSTIDSKKAAEDIASQLVEKRLAACVQIVPGLTSVYWWHDKIDRSAEWLLVIKTTAGRFPLLETALIDIHPYCPEIVAVKIEKGAAQYLRWMETELDGG